MYFYVVHCTPCRNKERSAFNVYHTHAALQACKAPFLLIPVEDSVKPNLNWTNAYNILSLYITILIWVCLQSVVTFFPERYSTCVIKRNSTAYYNSVVLHPCMCEYRYVTIHEKRPVCISFFPPLVYQMVLSYGDILYVLEQQYISQRRTHTY